MSGSKYFSMLIALFLVMALGTAARAQAPRTNTHPEAQPPAGKTRLLDRNEFQAGMSVTEVNKIVQPIPLSAREKEAALAGIDKHIEEEATVLKGKLKQVLPDELGVLSKTVGWNPDQQNALIVAWRAIDPAASLWMPSCARAMRVSPR